MAGLLETLQQSFFSKAGEKLAECGWEVVTGNKDPKFILKTLQRSLKSLSYRACDIKDQIKHGEESGKKKRKREVENWLEEVTEIESELGALQNEVQEEGFLGRFFGEGRVSELNTRVCELVEQSRHFGELLLVARENRGELLLTTRLTGEMFETNIKVIWEWLVNDNVKSIGIYGMGGVGKTTLAKHINNRLWNENRRVYWVTVSQVFTTNKLQSDIAKVIDLDLSDEENEDKRAGRLNQALSKKEDFVLILDDVWSEIDLEQMGDPLGVEGCRLIVTTRSLRVCQRIDCEQKIEVKTLQTNESWALFKETLGRRSTITSEVEKIAKLVAEECDGLPLGIIVLAKRMKGVTDIREWRNVHTEMRESPMEKGDMKERVFRVLKYSFDQLDPKLQLCFLYWSLYPEDFEIEKDELVRRFISEELVDTRKSSDKQLDQGYTMISKLVDLCLLESTTGDSKCVKMHDLLRDMALSIARESPKYKVFAGLALKEIPNEKEWTEDVEKMSLMWNHIVEIPQAMAPNCSKISTLLLNNNPLKCIPESFFAKMSGLRILDLSRTLIRELPNSLSDLESLNTLLLHRCYHLVSLPFLGKLKALKDLDLSYTLINEMPKGMENLINLKILLFRGTDNLKLLPGGLPLKSRNLQHLELPLQIEVPVYEIEWSKLQLRKFVGRFKDVSDFNWFQSQTGGLISKFSYFVVNEHNVESDYFLDNGENTLLMRGCRLRREGEDGVIILPEKIQNLRILRCKGLSRCLLDDFKPSSSVIEVLRIEDCEGIESIWNINDQLMVERAINVERVSLNRLPDLKGLVNWEVGGGPEAAKLFSSLQRLNISNCNKMKTLGLPFPWLHNIKSITVTRCDEIEEVIESVEEAEEISEPTISLPNLENLTLRNLPKLKSICKARIDCKSIKEIKMLECPRVKKLPWLHNIKSIFVESCDEIEEVIESVEEAVEISEPTISLPNLERLWLENLPKLKSICKERIDCKSIEMIGILGCPRVKKLPLLLPPALRTITIERAKWRLLKWDDISHKHLLRPFVRFR